MELSSEVFTCSAVEWKPDARPYALHEPWTAYWHIKFNDTGATMMQLTGGNECPGDPAPKVGDTKTPTQMGFRKWGYQGDKK